MAERMRFILDGDDNLTPVLNRAGDSSARLHRRLNDDMTANSRVVAGFTRDASGRLRDLNGRFLSAADAARAMAGGMPDLTGRLGDVSAAGGDAAASLGRSSGGLGGAMGGVAAVAGLSLLPALGALVPMMAGTALAAGTLKLGFAGVGDAMEASGKSKEEYEKALKKLSPEARSFTKELVGMKKEFAGVGKDVQKAMLPGFTQAVKSAGPLVKILGENMTDLGGTFGSAAKAAGRVFKESGFQRDLQANLTLGKQFVGDMMSGFGGLGRSLLDFGAASKPTLTALSGGIRGVLGKGLPGMFDGLKVGISGSSKFLNGFFNMINSLLPAIGRFAGEVARATGPLLGEMFTSLGVRGAGALDMLGQGFKALTPVFKDFGYGLRATTDLIRIIGPTVRDTASALVGSLLPSFAQVDQAKGPLQRLSETIQRNKGSIQEFARMFGTAVLDIAGAAVQSVPVVISGFRMMSVAVLTALDGLISGAARAFGWIPGIGDKLKGANRAFDSFKDGYLRSLTAAEGKAQDFAASVAPKLASGKLKLNISNWNSQIATAKAQMKSVPPEKRAALKARIDDLQAKVRAAKGQLASIRDKSVNLSLRDRASAGARAIQAAINKVRGKTVTLTTVRQTINVEATAARSAKNLAGYAGGGKPKPGELAWVGEEGPELVRFGSGAQVFDHRTSMAMGARIEGAGRDAGAGLAAGMASSIGGVGSAARVMAAAVTSGIRTELQISSPSKKTRALAQDVAKGFLEGLTGSRDKIKATAKDLAADIKTAFSGKKEASLLRMLGEVNFKNSYLAKSRDWVANKIKAATEYAGTVTTNARSGAQLGSLGLSVVTGGGIKTAMGNKLSKIKRFTAYIKKLAARGLHKTLLRQVLDMGPEEGYTYAAALAEADQATLSSISRTQHGLDDATRSLGRIGADRLYDAGKNAGAGFLEGLKSSQKRIEDLMLRIAKAMQKAIKRSLGIKSPSTVMARLGAYSTEGLARGLVDGMPVLDSALAAVSGRVAATQPVLGRPAVTGSGGGVVVHIHVSGTVMDENAVAMRIQKSLLGLKRTKGGAALGLA